MKLNDLLKVMDLDTKINIQQNYKEIYEGNVADCRGYTFIVNNPKIKSVWYSTLYNAIMIELQ